jgi:hypothetical protein
MPSEFSRLVEELGAEIDRRRKAGTLAKAMDAGPPPIAAPAPPDLQTLPATEIRRRILDAESEIFAKAFVDLQAGRISSVDIARMEIQMNNLRAMDQRRG